jgi:hypothetical protein
MSPKGAHFALATSSQACFVICIFKLTVLLQFHAVGHTLPPRAQFFHPAIASHHILFSTKQLILFGFLDKSPLFPLR